MGKIVAIGGGENGRPGTNYETGALDREIVRLTGKARPNFLFIGLANPFAVPYFDVMRGIYGGMYGCETAHLTEADCKDAARASAMLAAADIIYVGGGNTLRLMTLFRKYGLDAMLEEAYATGKVLCGVSAGAICWCAYGNSDSRRFTSGSDRLIKVRGLGFLPVLLCPHFDGENHRRVDLPRMMRVTHRIPAIALDNGAALEVVDSQARVLTSLDGAGAYRCNWRRGEYHCEALEQNVFRNLNAFMRWEAKDRHDTL